jgi:hypothetical protein
MYQAAATAEVYAREGAKVFEDIFGTTAARSQETAAVFLAGFMRAAAQDFDTVMRINTGE